MSTSSVLRRGRRAATLTAIVAGVVAFPAVAPNSPTVDTAAAAACTKARVGGATKCLGPGQFCAVRNQRDYRRAGYVCARGSDGRYRLRYR